MAREDAQAEWRAANESLRAAAEQLHMARRGVLSGVYNPYELGEALRVYREAKQRACRARDMLASLPDSNQAPEETGTLTAATQTEPPSPRLLFARWLVQNGRLSDN